MDVAAPQTLIRSCCHRYLDIFNVMAYDYHGAFDTSTGHVAPLYLSPLDLLPEHDAFKYFSVVG